MPLIFLGVAAFILNIALVRALSLQRAQIAALKALGYTNGELGWHYIKWGLAIAAVGALAGVAAGAWLGSGMIGLYNQFFRFPALDYHLSVGVAVVVVRRQPAGRRARRAVGGSARRLAFRRPRRCGRSRRRATTAASSSGRGGGSGRRW